MIYIASMLAFGLMGILAIAIATDKYESPRFRKASTIFGVTLTAMTLWHAVYVAAYLGVTP